MAQLRQLMLLVRDLTKSQRFYQEGLGLELIASHEGFAEFGISEGSSLVLKHSTRESECTSGYNLFMNFDVKDMDSTIQSLLTMGAILDGPIKYPSYGKIASLRTPDGNMIGVFEPATIPSST